ncbi:hypothetical protein CR513_50470, partial [Mucuna pruriens]
MKDIEANKNIKKIEILAFLIAPFKEEKEVKTMVQEDLEVEPCMVLGGNDDEKGEGKMKSIKHEDFGHTDSVLGLAWSKEYKNIYLQVLVLTSE